MVTPITEAHDRQANFDFATGEYLWPDANSGIERFTYSVQTDGRVGIELDKTALEPRIGLAWTPLGRQDRDPCRIRHVPRFLLEPGRAGAVGEPAVLRRNGQFFRPLLRLGSRSPRRPQTIAAVSHGFPFLGSMSTDFQLPNPLTFHREPFSPRIWISSRAWCNSSTSTSNTNAGKRGADCWDMRVLAARIFWWMELT